MKRKMLSFLLTVALVFTLGLPGSGYYVQAASPEWSQAGPRPNNSQVECLFEFNDQLYKGTAGNGVLTWNGGTWIQAGTAWPDGGSVMCTGEFFRDTLRWDCRKRCFGAGERSMDAGGSFFVAGCLGE